MIKKVNKEDEEVITLDKVKSWIREPMHMELERHIIVAIGYGEPYILKILPNFDGIALFDLSNSKMNMNGKHQQVDLKSLFNGCDEIYVLDDLKDLIELLKRFV